MPIYEYACNACGHRFEQKQSFNDEPVAVCPECGEHVHRVLHPAGIIFKGSGWYITDSRKSGEASGNGGESKPAATSENAKAAAPATSGSSSGTGTTSAKSES